MSSLPWIFKLNNYIFCEKGSPYKLCLQELPLHVLDKLFYIIGYRLQTTSAGIIQAKQVSQIAVELPALVFL